MHVFLFTNSTQRELVPICTQNATATNFSCIINLVWVLFVCLYSMIITQEPRNQFASTLIWKPCNAQPTCTFKYSSWANLFRPSLDCTANYTVTKVATLYNHGNIHSVLVKKTPNLVGQLLYKQICFRPTLGSQASFNLICLGDAGGSAKLV